MKSYRHIQSGLVWEDIWCSRSSQVSRGAPSSPSAARTSGPGMNTTRCSPSLPQTYGAPGTRAAGQSFTPEQMTSFLGEIIEASHVK